ncbi:hypothetical protein [Aquipseudomonas campi]
MLLNSAPLNTVPINATPGQGVEPTPVVAVPAFHWSLRLIVGDEDWTARLVGRPEVDREEGAAGVCSFELCLPPGPVYPLDWKGRPVTLDYLTTLNGEAKESRLFTGRIVDPTWDKTYRSLSCTCTDQLQQRVEALEISEIDALAGGYWSADVFEPVDGRSRWDYAQERMSSRTASLDCDAYGALRVSSWFSKPVADFIFGPGSTVYDSLQVELSDLSEQTNTVEITADYRFSRLRQLNQGYGWAHPGTGGSGGEQGFCTWRLDNTELPDVPMIQAAVSGSGQVQVAGAYYTLPPSGVYCDPPVIWKNDYTELLLGASFVGARRWVQSVTEKYRLTVVADASVAAVGAVVARQSSSVSIENPRSDTWESDSNYSGGDSGHEDLRDEPRRQAILRTLLNQALAQIVGAHRGTLVSWDVPTSWVLGLDLVHTVELGDFDAGAHGKITRLQHRLDLAAGSALTSITVAIMRGGGNASDPLIPPPFTVEPPPPPPEGPGIGGSLGTQLGGRGAVYDPDRDGFSGNYTNHSGVPGDFPRRFQITADEIPAETRDESIPEVAAAYRVAIPNDRLELQ